MSLMALGHLFNKNNKSFIFWIQIPVKKWFEKLFEPARACENAVHNLSASECTLWVLSITDRSWHHQYCAKRSSKTSQSIFVKYYFNNTLRGGLDNSSIFRNSGFS